jgi:hypothetical protein
VTLVGQTGAEGKREEEKWQIGNNELDIGLSIRTGNTGNCSFAPPLPRDQFIVEMQLAKGLWPVGAGIISVITTHLAATYGSASSVSSGVATPRIYPRPRGKASRGLHYPSGPGRRGKGQVARH